jgi:PleD family two-component response regulator
MGILTPPLTPKDAMEGKELLQRTDKAMYDAKREGRNRFCSYQQFEE